MRAALLIIDERDGGDEGRGRMGAGGGEGTWRGGATEKGTAAVRLDGMRGASVERVRVAVRVVGDGGGVRGGSGSGRGRRKCVIGLLSMEINMCRWSSSPSFFLSLC